MTETVTPPKRIFTLYDAVREAAKWPDGTVEHIFYTGVVDGFLAADLGEPYFTRYHEHVGAYQLAQATPNPGQAEQLAALSGSRYTAAMINACGMLWGFAEATETRDDAETCGGCDRRILLKIDDDIEQCPNHGYMHYLCRNGFCRRSCREGEL